MAIQSVDLSSGDSFRDGFPHEFFRHLRDNVPVFWHEPTDHTPDAEGFWVISRYADVAAIVRDPKTFSSDRGGERPYGGTSLKDERSSGHMLNQTDDPHHRRLRELVQKGFTTKTIAALEQELRERTRVLIDAATQTPTFDFVSAIGRELPAQAICMVLGIPQQDRAKLVAWIDAGIENQDGEVIGHHYLRLLGTYAEGLIESKRENPGADILSTIVHARLDGYDPAQLSTREIKLFFNLLFPAGAETTRSALSGAIKAFIDYPDQWRKLQTNPQLMRTAIEEILRWTTPSIYKRRTATCDTTFNGVFIRAGEKVSSWEMSANRDEREFITPFIFDIARTPNRHMGFGAGVHFCLGSQLARLEIRVVLEELMMRFDKFTLDGEPQFTPNNRLLGYKYLPVSAQPRSQP
jgi:cytochrome P450